MVNEWATGRFADVGELDEHVRDQGDLARVVEAMHADLVAHPDEWENHTLERYLEALAAVMADNDAPAPSWSQIARFLVAASGYE